MPVQTKDTKRQETLDNKGEKWVFLAEVNVSNSTTMAHTYLPIVRYSTEELEFKVKSSWIFVEQPPKAAGQVLHTDIHRQDKSLYRT